LGDHETLWHLVDNSGVVLVYNVAPTGAAAAELSRRWLEWYRAAEIGAIHTEAVVQNHPGIIDLDVSPDRRWVAIERCAGAGAPLLVDSEGRRMNLGQHRGWHVRILGDESVAVMTGRSDLRTVSVLTPDWDVKSEIQVGGYVASCCAMGTAIAIVYEEADPYADEFGSHELVVFSVDGRIVYRHQHEHPAPPLADTVALGHAGDATLVAIPPSSGVMMSIDVAGGTVRTNRLPTLSAEAEAVSVSSDEVLVQVVPDELWGIAKDHSLVRYPLPGATKLRNQRPGSFLGLSADGTWWSVRQTGAAPCSRS
jgi:hypothetical protein